VKLTPEINPLTRRLNPRCRAVLRLKPNDFSHLHRSEEAQPEICSEITTRIIDSDDAAAAVECQSSRIANFGTGREPTPLLPNARHRSSILEVVMEAPANAPPLAQPHSHSGTVVVASVWLAFCVIAAMVAHGNALAEGAATQLARECAVKEVAVITVIEDHGAADDLPVNRLAEAGQTMMDARSACYQGRVSEALAMYDRILALGPVASVTTGQR
jgi:hypothetical protein